MKKIINKSKSKYNLGFSLVEMITAIAISTILILGISAFYTFYHKKQIQAQRVQDISSTMDIVKNTLISDYKFHRGDPSQHVLNSQYMYRKPVLNELRLDFSGTVEHNDGTTLKAEAFITSPEIRIFKNYSLRAYPMTFKQMIETSSESNVTGCKQWKCLDDTCTNKQCSIHTTKAEPSNSKLLVIEQKVKDDTTDTFRIRRIEYSMHCKKLPNKIAARFKDDNTLKKALDKANFFAKTKCMKNPWVGYATWGDDEGYYGGQVKKCFNNTNKTDNTVVLRRDVWENWNDDWDENNSENYDQILSNISQTTFFPNITENSNPYILGITFCAAIPTTDDLLTANNSIIELYYFMLDDASFKDPTKEPKIEVKTELIYLKRDSSITTKISPIKK